MAQNIGTSTLGWVLLSAASIASGPSVQVFRSPDGSRVARIVSTVAGRHPGTESRVEIATRSGRILTTRSYISKDGEHGYGVMQAAWTPNGRFFVWMLQSSGGHSPWHGPMDFWSRQYNCVFSLDHLLGDAVISRAFVVKAPDRIKLRIKGSTEIEGVPATIRLGRLVRARLGCGARPRRRKH